ncbi:MAG: hypothetical protein AAGH65_03770 [Pseudomonadota bacterium]
MVTGLGTRSATFRLNFDEQLPVSDDGTFCFSTLVQGGQLYSVEVIEQPANGTACAGSELSGIAISRVSIDVDCTQDRTQWNQFNWDGANWN